MLKFTLHTLFILGVSVSPLSAQDVGTWALVTDLRIGSVDAPNYSLTTINDIEVAPDGRIYVAQPMERLIRVYDEHGRFLYNIGREGDGPGEFRNVYSLGYSAGRIQVLDNRRDRLSQFSLDGGYINSWGAPDYSFPAGLTAAAPRALLIDGSIVVIPFRLYDETNEIPVLQFDSAGGFLRTLALIKVGGRTRRVRAGELEAVIPRPVTSHTLWSIDRHGQGFLLVHRTFGDRANPAEFHLMRIGVSGDTTLSRRYRVPVREIDRTDLADSIRGIAEQIARIRPFPATQIAELYHNGWDVPVFQAPVDRVVVGDDGSIWLRQGAFLASEATWWVINEQGDLIARLRIPTRLNVMRVSKDYVWGVETGEFDESYVVRKRISRRSSP